MAARVAIPKSVRFEVFKRDKFTCQYCGRKAPDIVLECDHIHPVAEGGTNDILNLLTSCEDCNAGKGARKLSDDSAVVKARNQMEVLQERREQLEMMMAWHRSLSDLSEQEVDFCLERWSEITPGTLTASAVGRIKLKGWIKKYGVTEVIESMAACEKYVELVNGLTTDSSWEFAFNKVLVILRSRKLHRENPALAQAYHLKNIFVSKIRRGGRVVSWTIQDNALRLIQKRQEQGHSFETIRAIINLCRQQADVAILDPALPGVAPDIQEHVNRILTTPPSS